MENTTEPEQRADFGSPVTDLAKIGSVYYWGYFLAHKRED